MSLATKWDHNAPVVEGAAEGPEANREGRQAHASAITSTHLRRDSCSNAFSQDPSALTQHWCPQSRSLQASAVLAEHDSHDSGPQQLLLS
jgi:hypothetical protein